MKSWELLLKQYELLRREIVQCIYLRQLAVAGIYTAILAGIGVLISKGSALGLVVGSGTLPFIVLGFTFLVNSFGSLYLHEQHRNRRACLFNRVIERLLTWSARGNTPSKEDEHAVCDFIGWENFLVSKECKAINRRFYIARYLGVALPILVFGVPLFVGSFIAFPPYACVIKGELRLTAVSLSIVGVLGYLTVALVSACRQGCVSEDNQDETTTTNDQSLEQAHKRNNACPEQTCKWPAKQILKFVLLLLPYISPIGVIAFSLHNYSGGTEASIFSNLAIPLWIAMVLAFLLAVWSLYIFFCIVKWLVSEASEEEEKEVGKWVRAFCKRPMI